MIAFTSVAAQFDNLGDLILRKVLAEVLAQDHELRIFIGAADASYLDALELPREAPTYTSYWQWSQDMVSAGSRAALVFAPGEQVLDNSARTLARSTNHLALAALVKARHGRVLKTGRGYAKVTPAGLLLERLVLRFCDIAALRDTISSKLARRDYVPDLALSWAVPPQGGERTLTAVAFRADRPRDRDLLSACGPSLMGLDTKLCPVSQVQRDDRLTRNLAHCWGSSAVIWDQRSHTEQLARVVSTYQSSRYVVSNRLHALYFALVNGAVPIGLSSTRSSKVEAGLRSLGLESHIVTNPSELQSLLCRDHHDLEASADRALTVARRRIGHLYDEIGSVLSAGGTRGSTGLGVTGA